MQRYNLYLKNSQEDCQKNSRIRRHFIIFTILLIALGYFVFVNGNLVSAAETSYCCEKTTSGAYCQNAPKEQCASGFQSTPTACESTSYCKKGCCYDSDEGLCMENTPEGACKASNGIWSESAECQIPQCELGCCVLGQQAAFTSLQRCKKLSGLYGLKSDFRKNVADELSCIAIAQSQDIGACVFESDFVKTCKFTTRGECSSDSVEGGASASNSSSVEFFKDYLCTAEELDTDCQRTTETKCLEGKDGVYFIDSCGNPANIYDASKVNDIEYWRKVVDATASCKAGGKDCGNCDYLGGSICTKASATENPKYGNNVCKDINCYKTSNGKNYKNGESWCVYDQNNPNIDSPGSRYYRHLCFAGEEIVEPCADLRVETCVEDKNTEVDFTYAGCVSNRWQECTMQNKTDDCLNTDKRDCIWFPIGDAEDYGKYLKGDFKSLLDTKKLIGLALNVENVQNELPGRCVPKVAPGLNFWDSSSASQCSLASQSCTVKYEKKIIGQKKCVENCFCLEPATAVVANAICTRVGDCGADFNYIGKFTNKGYSISIGKKGEETKDSGRKEATPDTAAPTGGSAFTDTSSTTPSNSGFTNTNTNADTSGTNTGTTPASTTPAATTGSIIQGFIIKSIDKVRGK